MITFFTDPFEEEILYSTVARYHYYSGNVDCKDTITDIFGSDSAIPTIAFPSRLEHLSSQLCNNSPYTSHYFINYHTLFPVYAPFLPSVRKSEILNDMKYGNGQGIYTKIGMVAGSICKKEELFYCPECAENDILNHNEPYFHRVHQAQGVLVCPEHGCLLKKYPVTRNKTSRIQFIRLDSKILNFEAEYVNDSACSERLQKVAISVKFLLNNHLHHVDQKKIRDKYLNLLEAKGLLTCNGTVKQKELHGEFKNFWGEQFLKLIESSIDEDNEYNWLKVVTRKPGRVVHPLRHILLILFLCGNMDEFFRREAECDGHFGKGPWPCLNPVSDHYKQEVVYDLAITPDYKTRRPVGTFKCSCGFIYSRKGPDPGQDDRYIIGRIKNFGMIWENKLENHLVERQWGLRELAKAMQCDPKTVVKFADKFGLRNKINGNMKVETKVRENKVSMDYRAQYSEDIVKLIHEQPEYSRTQVRNQLQKQYSWFYKNDSKWLKDNLPLPQVKSSHNFKRIDWNRRDTELVEEIHKIYLQLIGSDVPVRITKSIIGRKLGKAAMLETKLSKLPKTNRYLVQILETVGQFQIRRAKLICNQLFKEKGVLSRWEVVRRAGLKTGFSDCVNKKIQNLIETYNNEIMQGGHIGR